MVHDVLNFEDLQWAPDHSMSSVAIWYPVGRAGAKVWQEALRSLKKPGLPIRFHPNSDSLLHVRAASYPSRPLVRIVCMLAESQLREVDFYALRRWDGKQDFSSWKNLPDDRIDVHGANMLGVEAEIALSMWAAWFTGDSHWTMNTDHHGHKGVGNVAVGKLMMPIKASSRYEAPMRFVQWKRSQVEDTIKRPKEQPTAPLTAFVVQKEAGAMSRSYEIVGFLHIGDWTKYRKFSETKWESRYDFPRDKLWDHRRAADWMKKEEYL